MATVKKYIDKADPKPPQYPCLYGLYVKRKNVITKRRFRRNVYLDQKDQIDMHHENRFTAFPVSLVDEYYPHVW